MLRPPPVTVCRVCVCSFPRRKHSTSCCTDDQYLLVNSVSLRTGPTVAEKDNLSYAGGSLSYAAHFSPTLADLSYAAHFSPTLADLSRMLHISLLRWRISPVCCTFLSYAGGSLVCCTFLSYAGGSLPYAAHFSPTLAGLSLTLAKFIFSALIYVAHRGVARTGMRRGGVQKLQM